MKLNRKLVAITGGSRDIGVALAIAQGIIETEFLRRMPAEILEGIAKMVPLVEI